MLKGNGAGRKYWGFERKRCKRFEGQNDWLLIFLEIIFGRFFIDRENIHIFVYIYSYKIYGVL